MNDLNGVSAVYVTSLRRKGSNNLEAKITLEQLGFINNEPTTPMNRLPPRNPPLCKHKHNDNDRFAKRIKKAGPVQLEY
jgi:hypothetical protein